MKMEIEFFDRNFIGRDPKPLMDHLRSVASGEASFFPNTLSLAYDKLFERSFPKIVPFDSGPSQVSGNQTATTSAPIQP